MRLEELSIPIFHPHLRVKSQNFLAYQAFIKKHARVFFYGAGKGAERLLACFERTGLPKPAGIIVSDGQSHVPDFKGILIHDFSEIAISPDDGILVTLREEAQADICAYLKSHGIAEEQILCQHQFFKDLVDRVDDACYLQPVHKTGPYFSEHLLEDIGKAEGTDKCSDIHDYLKKYEFFLQRYQGKAIYVLELGVFHGQSLRMWGKYFCNAQVVGVDIDPRCKDVEKGGNQQVLIRDLSLEESLDELEAYHPTVVIDDASHMWTHQIGALFLLWDALPHGGVYIIEDLETSFPSYRDTWFGDAIVPAYDVLSAIAEVATSREYLRLEGKHPAVRGMKDEIERIGNEMDLMSFLHGSCIMIKA